MCTRHHILPFSIAAVFALFALLASLPSWAVAPTVTNVRASQRVDGSHIVDVWYDLTDPDTPGLYVAAAISSDGGSTYAVSLTTVTGDIGLNISPGANKHVVWDCAADRPGVYWNNCKAAVTATDSPGGAYAGEMVFVPAGLFLMGNNGNEGYSDANELPQHEVTLSGYWIGKHEVTRGEYRAFIDAGGYTTQSYWSTDGWLWKGSRSEPSYWPPQQSWGTGQFTQTEDRPAVGVTYYEAEAFCNWAGVRLPTEAEWEKAARWTGSHPNVYPWGDAWDSSKCNGTDDTLYVGQQTGVVGSYPSGASPYGCLDMAGNVWEWCKDWYQDTYYSQTPPGGSWLDPQGPPGGSDRVIRGGCFAASRHAFRCADRTVHSIPNTIGYYYGFRVAR